MHAQDGLAEVIATIDDLKDDDKTELIDLLDCHFDPEKQAILPIVKKHRSKRGMHATNGYIQLLLLNENNFRQKRTRQIQIEWYASFARLDK